jgi:cytoskeletal protein RodZ
MAGKTVRPASIGVGPALRRAREIGGTTLEEAARDTKLTVEQLQGLESEDFELLGEEVYVRAMLRTYAQYLGLKPGKVMSAYAKHVDEPEPPPPPAKLGRVEQALAAARIRDNQRFLLLAASVVLLAAVAVGIVAHGGAPKPAAIPTATAPFVAPTPATGVGVTVQATAGVEITAESDGGLQQTVSLGPGESISFMASDRLVLSTSDGGAVTIVLNGHDLGVPGTSGEPWSHTFAAPDSQAPASP